MTKWTVSCLAVMAACSVGATVFKIPDESGMDPGADLRKMMEQQRKLLRKVEMPVVKPAPKTSGPQDHKNVHLDMSSEDLQFHFGVTQPDQVDPTSYQVVRIVNPVSRKSGTTHRLGKRSGGDPTTTHEFEMSAFGSTYKVPMRQNDRILKFPSKRSANASKRATFGRTTWADDMDYGEDYGEESNSLERNEILANLDDDDEDDLDHVFDHLNLRECTHYTHSSERMFGALSDCGAGKGAMGYLTDLHKVLEVNPLDRKYVEKFGDDSSSEWHVVVRRDSEDATGMHKRGDHALPASAFQIKNMMRNFKPTMKKRGSSDLTMELAVMVDYKAYKTYYRMFQGDQQRIVNLILAVINGVQALYHFQSLGRELTFSLVHLELHQSDKVPGHGGEQMRALNTFCKYHQSRQKELGAESDDNPKHWDAALMISGHNFWSKSKRTNKVSYTTMGLAAVDGMCNRGWNCVIAEMGVKNHKGKPYPSSGFTSVFVIAHELAHNLGMSHDDKAGCRKDGYIMSPSRGTSKGEVLWSRCSRRVMATLDKPCLQESASNTADNDPQYDHKRFGHMPGLNWTASEQCQFYTQRTDVDQYTPRDKTDDDMCQALWCKGAGSDYYSAGPALEGTRCGNQKYCFEGSCVSKSLGEINALRRQYAGESQLEVVTLPAPKPEAKAQWSEWTSWSECQSRCILNSKGAQYRRRHCIVPNDASYENSYCRGIKSETKICDFKCRAMQLNDQFASNSCRNFSDMDSNLKRDLSGSGRQYSHDYANIAKSCTVYCQKRNQPSRWYAPVVEMSNSETLTPYFPDGTKCHEDSKGNYYCKDHFCLPESTRRSRMDSNPHPVNYNLNARPEDSDLPEELKKYFTLDEEGNPEADDPNKLRIAEEEDTEFTVDEPFEPPGSKYQPR